MTGAKEKADDASPLAVRETLVGRDATSCVTTRTRRERMKPTEGQSVASLTEKLKAGDKSLVGNKGYRRYLKSSGPEHFTLDEAKIEQEKRFDGMWVLRTNTQLPTAEVALKSRALPLAEPSSRESNTTE